MEHEPVPPPTCEGYSLPIGGMRRDRETGLWFVDFFGSKAGPLERGPFATEDEARAALAELVSGIIR